MSLRRGSFLVVLAVVLLAALPSLAQEEPPAGAPQMSPEEAAAMEAWQKASTPGPQHARLATMAGDWNLSITMWMSPGAPPMTSTGTATRTVVMDGRHLQEDVVSSFMDMPFNGRAVTGYDNVKGTYWSTWIDSMTTGLMVSEGSWDEETGTGTFVGTYVDALSGQPVEMKSVIRVEGDREVHEMWETRGGEPFKTMEIVYERQ